jgi:hypothetical protein
MRIATHRDTREIGGDLPADLDLEGAVARGDPVLDLALDRRRLGFVDQAEQRHRTALVEHLVALEHLDRGGQRRHREGCRTEGIFEQCDGVHGLQPDRLFGQRRCDGPGLADGFRRVAGQHRRLAEAGTPFAVAGLDHQGLEPGHVAERQVIGRGQRQFELVDREAGETHGIFLSERRHIQGISSQGAILVYKTDRRGAAWRVQGDVWRSEGA